jgi:parvulin-like peptidyl-prolyl isomerase
MTFPPSDLPADVVQELQRHNLLQPLLQRRVITAAVADADVDPQVCRDAQEAFLRQRGLEAPEALEAFLTENGLSKTDLHWQIELPLRIQAHCRQHFRHKAEAHFLGRKNQLDRVVYSLLRVRDRNLARELYLRLETGEANFADLASSFAEGPEKQTRGIVGPVPMTQAHPQLAERLRISQPGRLMEPFAVEDWWLVVRLENYSPASFDDGTAEQMSRELFDQWVREEADLRLRALLGHGSRA